MAYPSHLARGALRNALRNHPDCTTVLNGRRVNDLTLDTLRTLLNGLGLDAAAIEQHAMAGSRLYPQNDTQDDAPEPQDAPPMPDQDQDQDAAAIEAEVQSVRGLIMQGGFGMLDDKIRALVTEARKPPVTTIVHVPVEPLPNGTIHVAKQTTDAGTWRDLFGVTGNLGDRTTALWDGTHPDTPMVNDKYIWPHPATEAALTQLSRGRNVMLYGPAGTGKTDFALQLAARTKRPFCLISCDNGTDASTLVGMTVPDANGGVTWQDGQLTRAIQTPGCVICLDEPSVARPGALFVMQNVLANRQLYIAETGRRVHVAKGVLFLATDNTNGTGGGARRGYTDTNTLNAAFLDRFGMRIRVEYLPEDKEAELLVSYMGCPIELARLLVSAATVTRAAADNQQLTHGIGLRRLLAWTEGLMDGLDPEYVFQTAILNCAKEQDVETLREQCLLAYDRVAVAAALRGTSQPCNPGTNNPTHAGRSAARDFTQV